MDRRSVIVQPPHVKGLKQRVMPVFESLGRAMAEMRSHYTHQDLATIANFMAELTATLRQQTTKRKQARRQPRIEHR